MITVKVGGDMVKEGLPLYLLSDLKELAERDRIVIVHGGGDIVTEIAEKLGKPQVFVRSPRGITSRYTDRETVEIYTMVMSGMVNSKLVAELHKVGLNAVGLSGIDGALIRAKRKKRIIIVDERGRRRIIEGGFTGRIVEVNVHLLELLLAGGYIPVVSPIAIGEEKELLNVDSDRAAANVAAQLKAEKVVFLTDVEGLILEGRIVKKLGLDEAQGLLGKVGAGMDKKLLASIEAVKGGVEEAVITTGFIERPLTKALNHQVGTVISAGS